MHTRTVGVRIGLTCVLHPSEGKDHAASSRSCRGTQGQLPWRTYAQRAGDRMLAASRLFERTWRTTLLEAVVRISQVSGCIPDRYQAATARSAQAGVVSPIELRNEQTGRNLTLRGRLGGHPGENRGQFSLFSMSKWPRSRPIAWPCSGAAAAGELARG